MKSLFLALAMFSAASPAMAHEGDIFEVGTRTVSGSETELVFTVRTQAATISGIHSDNAGVFYVIARTRASAGLSVLGGSGIGYIDVDFKAFTAEQYLKFSAGKVYVSASLLNAKVERDVTIDNGMMAMINLISFSAGTEIKASSDLMFFINGTLDLAGLAMSERLSDGSRLDGNGFGAGAKIGATYLGKYRIMLGTDYFQVSGKPKPETYYTCNTYRYRDYYGDYYDGGSYDPYRYPYDDGYYYYTQCGYRTTNVDQASRNVTNSYLRLQADLSKTLSVFGQVGYAVYESIDETGEIPNSTASKWNFRLGVAVRLHR